MELIKKAPAQNLDRSITSTSKSVEFGQKGIIVSSTHTTNKTVAGVKSQSRNQTCFNLSVKQGANHELVNAFLKC